MNDINEYFIQAELSQAAYGKFSVNAITAEALSGDVVDMSPTQANKFVNKWQVSAQHTDPITGVSATVFEEIATGAKHLAIRGTEISGRDLLADRLLASSLPSILNPQFIALKVKLDNDWLNDPAILQGHNFTVSGHSLGGYLAAAVKQSYSQITDAYLYNAPGVSGLLGNLADALGSLFGTGSISPDNIWNIRGSEGFSAIAGLGFQLGTPVNIQIEESLLNDHMTIASP